MPPKIPPLVDTRVLRPAQTAIALDLVREIDLLRLKTIARWHARGLPPDVTWEDLLQEAITRVLVGTRRVPEGVTMVAFIAGIMRSLRTDHWRRALRASASVDASRIQHEHNEGHPLALPDPVTPSPERALIARQALTAIERLFADDPVVLKIIAGLGEGLSAQQIRASAKLSKTEYNSARRRIRRTLLREGLTCEPK
jgi:DNA-directed RNA polymerase specialized sigma24 family protein